MSPILSMPLPPLILALILILVVSTIILRAAAMPFLGATHVPGPIAALLTRATAAAPLHTRPDATAPTEPTEPPVITLTPPSPTLRRAPPKWEEGEGRSVAEARAEAKEEKKEVRQDGTGPPAPTGSPHTIGLGHPTSPPATHPQPSVHPNSSSTSPTGQTADEKAEQPPVPSCPATEEAQPEEQSPPATPPATPPVVLASPSPFPEECTPLPPYAGIGLGHPTFPPVIDPPRPHSYHGIGLGHPSAPLPLTDLSPPGRITSTVSAVRGAFRTNSTYSISASNAGAGTQADAPPPSPAPKLESLTRRWSIHHPAGHHVDHPLTWEEWLESEQKAPKPEGGRMRRVVKKAKGLFKRNQ